MALAAGLSTHYTAAAAVGTVLTAKAEEVARGRRTASYRIEVSDGEGALVAWFQALAYRTGNWHLGESRWPAEWRNRY
ncbi:MAG: PaaI family thioesterase [Actinomycetota bacterium]